MTRLSRRHSMLKPMSAPPRTRLNSREIFFGDILGRKLIASFRPFEFEEFEATSGPEGLSPGPGVVLSRQGKCDD